MGNRWFGRHSFAKKAVGALCLFAFFVNFSMAEARAALDMGGAYGMPVAPPAYGQFATLDVDTFSIPAHLGEIKHAFKGTSDKFVVHLQDAHCNFYAQHKISDIIDYLTGEYGIRLVNLEGGVGDYDLDVFTSISGQAIRREVADHFVKKGEINGAEFYAVNNPEKVRLWGVEDKDLYLTNLKIYRDSLAYKDEVEKYLKELTYIMNNLKRHIYTPELLKLDMAYSAYKAGNKPFREYLEFLIARAASAGIGVKRFENLHLLARAMKQEEGIDFKKANIQRNILVDELKKGLSNNEVRELVSKSVAFKTKRISRKGFYDYLLKKARSMMINIGRFPALTSYIEYVTVYESVDRSAVMEEMDALEAAIKEPLYRNDTQRRLNALSRNLALMKNIFAISLTRTDYRYYLENRDSFAVDNFTRFIEKEAPKYRIDARPSADIGRLDECRERIEKFFEYSFTRDEVFLKNMRFGPAPGETESAMLMTGGFHTESLCGLFKKEGISYVSIMPKFTSGKGYESPYFDLLAGRTTDLRRMLSSVIAKACMMQIASMLSSLGAEVWGRANIEAFKAAVLIQEIIVKGKRIAILDNQNSPVRDAEGNSMMFGEGSAAPEEMSIRELLDAVHQRYIDGQMEKADFGDIDDIAAILEEIKGFLRSIGAGEETLGNVEALKTEKGDSGEALVRLARGIDFRGHAGGRGIRVNADLKGDDLKAVIVHEIIAGLYGDHFLAERVERAFREGQTAEKLLSGVSRLDKPVWDMTPGEKLLVNRDFAAASGISISDNPLLEIFCNRGAGDKKLISSFLKQDNDIKTTVFSEIDKLSDAEILKKANICLATEPEEQNNLYGFGDIAFRPDPNRPDLKRFLTLREMVLYPTVGVTDITQIIRHRNMDEIQQMGDDVAKAVTESLYLLYKGIEILSRRPDIVLMEAEDVGSLNSYLKNLDTEIFGGAEVVNNLLSLSEYFMPCDTPQKKESLGNLYDLIEKMNEDDRWGKVLCEKENQARINKIKDQITQPVSGNDLKEEMDKILKGLANKGVLTPIQRLGFMQLYEEVAVRFSGMDPVNKYHDFRHMTDVVRIVAQGISRMEGAKNPTYSFKKEAFKALLAALYHDIAYSEKETLTHDHVEKSVNLAQRILRVVVKTIPHLDLNDEDINDILSMIASTSITPLQFESQERVKELREKGISRDKAALIKMNQMLHAADLLGAAATPRYLFMLPQLYRELANDFKSSRKCDTFGSALQLLAGTHGFQTVFAWDIVKEAIGAKDNAQVGAFLDKIFTDAQRRQFEQNMEIAKAFGDAYNKLKNAEAANSEIEHLEVEMMFVEKNAPDYKSKEDMKNILFMLKMMNKMVKGDDLTKSERAALTWLRKDPAFECDASIVRLNELVKSSGKLDLEKTPGALDKMIDAAAKFLASIEKFRARNSGKYGFDKFCDPTSGNKRLAEIAKLADTYLDKHAFEEAENEWVFASGIIGKKDILAQVYIARRISRVKETKDLNTGIDEVVNHILEGLLNRKTDNMILVQTGTGDSREVSATGMDQLKDLMLRLHELPLMVKLAVSKFVSNGPKQGANKDFRKIYNIFVRDDLFGSFNALSWESIDFLLTQAEEPGWFLDSLREEDIVKGLKAERDPEKRMLLLMALCTTKRKVLRLSEEITRSPLGKMMLEGKLDNQEKLLKKYQRFVNNKIADLKKKRSGILTWLGDPGSLEQNPELTLFRMLLLDMIKKDALDEKGKLKEKYKSWLEERQTFLEEPGKKVTDKDKRLLRDDPKLLWVRILFDGVQGGKRDEFLWKKLLEQQKEKSDGRNAEMTENIKKWEAWGYSMENVLEEIGKTVSSLPEEADHGANGILKEILIRRALKKDDLVGNDWKVNYVAGHLGRGTIKRLANVLEEPEEALSALITVQLSLSDLLGRNQVVEDMIDYLKERKDKMQGSFKKLTREEFLALAKSACKAFCALQEAEEKSTSRLFLGYEGRDASRIQARSITAAFYSVAVEKKVFSTLKDRFGSCGLIFPKILKHTVSSKMESEDNGLLKKWEWKTREVRSGRGSMEQGFEHFFCDIAYTLLQNHRRQQASLNNGNISAGLIGKVYGDNGQLLMGGFTVKDEGDKVRVSHDKLNKDIMIEKGAVTRKPKEFVESLISRVEEKADRFGHKEKQNLIDNIEGLKEYKEIASLKDHKYVKGIREVMNAEGEKRLYLAESLLDEDDPLAWLGVVHELIESPSFRLPEYEFKETGIQELDGRKYVDVVSRHTHARGVGKKVRMAYKALVRDFGENVDILLPEQLVRALEKKMEKFNLRPKTDNKLTLSEKALIAFNFMSRQELESPVKGQRPQMYLWGVQDKLDPAGNYEFTRQIKFLDDDLRRGAINYHLIPVYNGDTRRAQEKYGRKTGRDLRKIGTNTMVSNYAKGELRNRLGQIKNEMLKNWGKFPEVFVHCLTQEDVKVVQGFMEELRNNGQEKVANRFVIGNDVQEGDADTAQVPEVKVIRIATHILNNKRLTDLGLQYDDSHFNDSTKRLLKFLMNSGFVSEGHIGDLANVSADGLAEIMSRLFKGAIPLRLTRVNWKEIEDYNDSMAEVSRAL